MHYYPRALWVLLGREGSFVLIGRHFLVAIHPEMIPTEKRRLFVFQNFDGRAICSSGKKIEEGKESCRVEIQEYPSEHGVEYPSELLTICPLRMTLIRLSVLAGGL